VNGYGNAFVMNKIMMLKNPVQEYAWGSGTAIQALLGIPASDNRPMAELWMGAHPKAPSRAFINGEWKSLSDLIKKNPESILGKNVADAFSNRLPFLFKILAAGRPLSIQVHPDLDQARSGFKRENNLKIPLDAPARNYRDDNHKPEILCALNSFQALKGFRKIEEILNLMNKVSSSGLSDELSLLENSPDSQGLKIFFSELMTMDKARKELVVSEAAGLAEKFVNENQAFYWMIELSHEYPGDIGVLSPLILNLVQLNAGEAIYLPAGELHSYLQGVGIELMANSDNVLRGGLTPKHIDVPELLKIVNFDIEPVKIIKPVMRGNCVISYPAPADEFMLSMISVDNGRLYTSARDRSVEVLICFKGKAVIRDLGSGESLSLTQGSSVIVPSCVLQYTLEGVATFYSASVPL